MAIKQQRLNVQRRRVIQGVALSAAALGAPSMANALCNGAEHKLTQTASPISNDDVSIELAEANMPAWHSPLAQITVTNKSNHDIKISHLSPGAITTQKGVYQLNTRFGINPLAIRAGGKYIFWMTPDTGAEALLSTSPALAPQQQQAFIDVTVVAKNNSVTRSTKQRVQAII